MKAISYFCLNLAKPLLLDYRIELHNKKYYVYIEWGVPLSKLKSGLEPVYNYMVQSVNALLVCLSILHTGISLSNMMCNKELNLLKIIGLENTLSSDIYLPPEILKVNKDLSFNLGIESMDVYCWDKCFYLISLHKESEVKKRYNSEKEYSEFIKQVIYNLTASRSKVKLKFL